MAPRRNITSKNVGAWLGGNRGYVQSGSNTDTSAKVDSGGGQMEAVRGELGLGAYAAGIGATAAIGAGIAAARSPLGRRATRAVTGRQTSYFVHGSPTKGIKKLDPKYETMPDKIVSEPFFEERWPEGVDPSQANLYGWPITKASGQKGSSNVLIPKNDLQHSVKDSAGYAWGGGSLYIAKAPRKHVGYDGDNSITAPSKVIAEIRTPGKTADQIVKETEKALKKLGFVYPKARGGGKSKH